MPRARPALARGFSALLSKMGIKAFVSLAALCTCCFAAAMAFLLKENLSFAPASVPIPAARLNEALQAVQEKLKADPEDLRALVKIGILHFQEGEGFYPQAVNELEEARSLGALDPRVFYYLGIMYQSLGLYPFAVEEDQRYLRNFPEDKDVRQREAKLLYQAGRYNEAVDEYKRLAARYPKDPVVEENLALSSWKAGDAGRAAEIFNSLALSWPPGYKREEFYLGQMALQDKDYEGAVGHLLKSVPLRGALPAGGDEQTGAVAPHDIYFSLATAWQRLGDWGKAKSAWESALSFSPGDSKAKMSLRRAKRLLAIQERRQRRAAPPRRLEVRRRSVPKPSSRDQKTSAKAG